MELRHNHQTNEGILVTNTSTSRRTHGSPLAQARDAGPLGVRPRTREGASTQQPPSSNTGAQNTQANGPITPNEPRRAVLDWCALTLPEGTHPDQVGQLLGLNPHDVRELDRGVNGYRSGRAYGHTRVYWDGNAGMGVHVIASGEACRELEAATGAGYWKQLYHVVKGVGGHFTRIDLAIDDFTGALDLEAIESQAKAGLYRSKWKGGHVHDSFGAKQGKTIYFGSRQSAAMARFYDKQDEQGTEYPWVRAELELKQDHANTVMQLIGHDAPVGDLVAGILGYYLTFIDQADDSNRARWPASAWWETWLADVKPLRLTTGERKLTTIEEMCANLERQYAPTLATVKRALGHRFESWLRHIDRNGASRMKDRHHTALHLAGAA